MSEKGGPTFASLKPYHAIAQEEQSRTTIGKRLYDSLYNRIYDPDTYLTDAEQKDLEPLIERVERDGIENVYVSVAQLYRKYKRYELSKFRLQWVSGGALWIDVLGHQLPPRVSDKINAYYKGYLFSIVEQAKLKRLFDPLDIRITEVLIERLLGQLFPSLSLLAGDKRKEELERLTSATTQDSIDAYIDNPDIQKRYDGFSAPTAFFWDKKELGNVLDTLLIIKSGLYLPEELTARVVHLSEILKKEIGKKRELDMLDAKVAEILVARVQEEIGMLIKHNKKIARKKKSKLASMAALQITMLESLLGRLKEVIS